MSMSKEMQRLLYGYQQIYEQQQKAAAEAQKQKQQKQQEIPQETPQQTTPYTEPSTEGLSPDEQELYKSYEAEIQEASQPYLEQREKQLQSLGIKPTEGTLYSVQIGDKWLPVGSLEPLHEWQQEQRNIFSEVWLPQYRKSKSGVIPDFYGQLASGRGAVTRDILRQIQVPSFPEMEPPTLMDLLVYRRDVSSSLMAENALYNSQITSGVSNQLIDPRLIQLGITRAYGGILQAPHVVAPVTTPIQRALNFFQLTHPEKHTGATGTWGKPPTQEAFSITNLLRGGVEYIKYDFPAQVVSFLSGVPFETVKKRTQTARESDIIYQPGSGVEMLDFGVGVVKNVESIVNPQVLSYTDLWREGKTQQYLKDIRGRETEFLGELFGEYLLAQGFGTVGSKVGLSTAHLILAGGINVGVQTGASVYFTAQAEGDLKKSFEEQLKRIEDEYTRAYSSLSSEQLTGLEEWKTKERQTFYGKTLPNWRKEQYNTMFSPRTIRSIGYQGAGLAIIGAGSLTAVGMSGKIGAGIVQSGLGRAGVNAAVDAATSYVLSGGDTEEALKGAAFGATFSLGSDYLFRPFVNEMRAKLPEWFPGSVTRLEQGPATTGKIGTEIPTYVSEEIEGLGGKKIRIVPDVSEDVIGVGGTTLDDLIAQYVGEDIPTGHATLKPEAFDLKKAGETVLKGFPTESSGFRKAKQLYHFYSAPGDEQFVNVYGGYAGIGEGYSDDAAKMVFGGKSTALVTTDTQISADFLRITGESIDDYLARTSLLSGETGIAQETVLGKSAERQLITPASYERFGIELPGSMFISEGQIGTYQIKIEPSGFLGRIPGIRSMFSRYTNLDVFLGSFAAAPDIDVPETVLDVQQYGESYGKTIVSSAPIIIKPPTLPSVPSNIVSDSKLVSEISRIPEEQTVSMFSVPKSAPSISFLSAPSISLMNAPSLNMSNIPSFSSKNIPSLSVPSHISKPSIPSVPSFPSYPSKSIPSFSLKDVPSFSVPSHPSTPSIPSFPSFPKKPSKPIFSSFPSYPSKPSIPSIPSFPSYPQETLSTPPTTFKLPKFPKSKKSDLFGGWRLKEHPIPSLEQFQEAALGIPQKKKKKTHPRKRKRGKRKR